MSPRGAGGRCRDTAAGGRATTLLWFVLALLALAIVAAAGAQGAPPGWSEPQDVSDEFSVSVLEGSAFNNPDISLDPGGDAVAVWESMDGSWDGRVYGVWMAERPLGGSWSAPRLLGVGREPRVATNAGTTAIAWSVGGEVVGSVRRGAGPMPVPRQFGVGRAIDVGVDDTGAATFLWSGDGSAPFGIRSARNTPASGWRPTTTISFSPTAHEPVLAVAGNGDAVAAWTAADGVRMTEFLGSPGWTTHRLVAPGARRPSIAANDRGDLVLAWSLQESSSLGTREAVHAATGTIRGGLDPARKLSDDIFIDFFIHEPVPEAAIGSSGDAVVAWNRTIYSGYASTVEVATGRAPFPWDHPRSISVPVIVPRPSLAVLADGTAIAMWRGGSVAVRPGDRASIRPSLWDPPFVVSASDADVYNPRLAVDDAGRVQAVWADLSRPQRVFEDRVLGMAVQAVSYATPLVAPGPPPPSAPSPTVPGTTTGSSTAPEAVPSRRRPAPRPAKSSRFTLSARQLLINQRIGQAAIRRLNALAAKLDGRTPQATRRSTGGQVTLTAAQLLINQRIYQAAVRRAAILEARLGGRAAPRFGRRTGGTVELTLAQLVINQRIAQAAVRRANTLLERA